MFSSQSSASPDTAEGLPASANLKGLKICVLRPLFSGFFRCGFIKMWVVSSIFTFINRSLVSNMLKHRHGPLFAGESHKSWTNRTERRIQTSQSGLIGLLYPSGLSQCGAKCCPPKRKAVIADHTLSYQEHPVVLCFFFFFFCPPTPAPQTVHTKAGARRIRFCFHYHAAQGNNLRDVVHLCLGKLHKRYIS